MSYNTPPPPPGYGYPNNPPMGIPPKPNNHLVWSILVTLFCCLPFGIAAIISSTKVDTLYTTGQFAEANAASASAKKWNLWGMGAIGILALFYLVAIIIGIGAEATGY